MKKVLLIYTGGTIGMASDPETGKLSPIDLSKILKVIPEIAQFDFEIDTLSVQTPIDSSEVNPVFWDDLVEMISANYDNYRGFVIMHGTDTMAFTASALSYALQGLQKPVVITGSQLPLGVIRTDGKENLISAIEIAGTATSIKEVVVYFEYQLYRGNRVQKVSSAHFDAFRSPNYPALAECGIGIYYNEYLFLQHNKEPKFQKGFSNELLVITLYPGINLKGWRAILESSSVRAIIIRSFGSGNAPINNQYFKEMLKYCEQNQIMVVNSSQCPEGEISADTYETGNWQKKYGVCSAQNMTFEATVTKLMFVLHNNKSYTSLCAAFNENLAGEFSIN